MVLAACTTDTLLTAPSEPAFMKGGKGLKILEDVGVTAYLGQVGDIDNTDILAAAGSIAGVEAEHTAGFRLINRDKITPNNVSFDMRRTSQEVIVLASPFITAPDPVPPASSFPT